MKRRKLSEIVFFASPDEKEMCAEIEDMDLKHIDELCPVITVEDLEENSKPNPDRYYIEHSDLHEIKQRYFELNDSSATGSECLVIVEDGEYLLPIQIREIVRENNWTCMCFRHISAGEPKNEVIILGIYYNEIATFEIDELFQPCGICSEILITKDSYCCHYNGHAIILFNREEFPCSYVSDGNGVLAVNYSKLEGINFLRQYLSHNAARMNG